MGAPSWINSKLGILTSSWLAEALRPLSDLRCRISQVSQAAEYFLKLTRDQDSQLETLRDLNCVGCAHMCGGGGLAKSSCRTRSRSGVRRALVPAEALARSLACSLVRCIPLNWMHAGRRGHALARQDVPRIRWLQITGCLELTLSWKASRISRKLNGTGIPGSPLSSVDLPKAGDL